MMKKLMMTTAAAMIAATMAQAQSSMADSILAQLQDQGYTRVEIKIGPTQIKAEAIKGTEKRELIYDRTTGELLKQEIDTVDAGDDTTPGVEVDTDDEDFIGGDDDGSDDESDDDGSDDNDDGSDDDSSDDDNSGSGSDDDDNDDGGNSGSGSNDDDDNSGSGSGSGSDDDDN